MRLPNWLLHPFGSQRVIVNGDGTLSANQANFRHSRAFQDQMQAGKLIAERLRAKGELVGSPQAARPSKGK